MVGHFFVGIKVQGDSRNALKYKAKKKNFATFLQMEEKWRNICIQKMVRKKTFAKAFWHEIERFCQNTKFYIPY